MELFSTFRQNARTPRNTQTLNYALGRYAELLENCHYLDRPSYKAMDGDGTPHKEKSLPSHDHFQSSAAVHSIPTRPTDSCPRFLSLFATGVHRPRACHFFLGTFLPF